MLVEKEATGRKREVGKVWPWSHCVSEELNREYTP
jgi:hypothetical protein